MSLISLPFRALQIKPPEPQNTDQSELFRNRLDNLINMDHPLVGASNLIDRSVFDDPFGRLDHAAAGGPAKTTRLMAGLLSLKPICPLSDEQRVSGCLENRSWQCLCGECYFQTRWPIDPRSLMRVRQRIGVAGCEWGMPQTMNVGVSSARIRKAPLQRVAVDPPVQDQAVSFPPDSQLLNCLRPRLVELCRVDGVRLRQSDTGLGPRHWLRVNRYGPARPSKRRRREVGQWRPFLVRMVCDMERKTVNDES